MNDFLLIRRAALDGRLPAQLLPHREYLASDEFAGRASFKGAHGRHDAVAATLHLLKRVALAPTDLALTNALLARGVVMPRYFGVCNPVPMFEVEPGDQDHAAICDAVRANVSSSMYLAALRVVRWREPDKAAGRERFYAAVARHFRALLDWPGPEAYRQAPDAAAARQQASLDALDSHLRAVQGRRQERLAALSEAAAPGIGSWTELLEDVVSQALVSEEEADGGCTPAPSPRMH